VDWPRRALNWFGKRLDTGCHGGCEGCMLSKNKGVRRVVNLMALCHLCHVLRCLASLLPNTWCSSSAPPRLAVGYDRPPHD